MQRSGVAGDKVTTFHNTTETDQLRASPSVVETTLFRRYHGIPEDAKCALFVGALEEYKAIDLLIATAADVFRRSSTAHLIVAGRGPKESTIRAFAERTGRVTYLGHVSRRDLVVPASASRIIVCPGRVGLLAVDALALKLPILTTNYEFHAPEIEYLKIGESLHIAESASKQYGEAWINLLDHPSEVRDEPPDFRTSVDLIVQSTYKVFCAR